MKMDVLSKAIVLMLLSFNLTSLFAQAPNWSINPNAYQYSMTIVAQLDVNCTLLANPSNRLGAFQNDTLRGHNFTSNVIGGKYLSTLTVYSNTPSGHYITLKFYNAVNDSLYNSIDSVIFQDNAIYGSSTNPFLVRTNHAPTSITISSDSLFENIGSGQLVGIFNSTDLDINQSHTYSLAAGTGAIDNSSFSIVEDSLFANFNPDFESKTSYSIRTRTTDSEGCFYEQVIPLKVINSNDAPTAINLTNNIIDENLPGNTTIGLLQALDQDVNESFSFSLVAGAGDRDNGSFSIFSNTLRSNSAFNYEAQNSFTIRIRVTDGANNVFEDSLSILVNNINDIPTDVLISADTLPENRPTNFLIGNLSTVDEDAGQNFAYSFENIPGNDNSNFLLVGNQLRTTTTFDFESRNQYFIYIRTNDLSGGIFTKLLVLNISDENDTPTNINISNASANEGAPVGLFIGTFTSTDQDAGQNYSYSLVSGSGATDNANFSVQNDSLFTAIVLDRNTQAQHSIRVQTNDGNGGIYAKAFSIFVKDVNNAPTAIALSNNVIPENTTLGADIGTLSSTDADMGDVHSYSLVSGAGGQDNGSFQIIGDKLKTNASFNYNTKRIYAVRIASNDGFGGVFQDTFKINIINSNDIPTDISIDQSTIKELMPINSVVGLLSTTDADSSDTHTYSLIAGNNDNSAFIISGNELRTQAVFNYEVKKNYLVEIRSSDNFSATYTKTISVQVTDSNDAPTNITLTADSVSEQQAIGTLVGKFSTVDEDSSDSFQYTLVTGAGDTHNTWFRINNDELVSDSIFDFIAYSSRIIRVRTTDLSGKFVEKSFIIRIVNKNDAPTQIALSDTTILENSPSLTRVGSFTSSDIDPAATFTYSFTNGLGDANNNLFSIINDELFTNTMFDFEVGAAYSIRVKVTDELGLSYEQAFNLSIIDKNEAPTSTLQEMRIQEDAEIGASVGQVFFTDVDVNDQLSYRLINENNPFEIEVFTGEILVNAALDYESNPTYELQIEGTDLGGLKDTAFVTIKVTDAIEERLPAPDMITPNNDGFNDLWMIQNVELYAEYSLVIFSANGEIVFERSSNYANDWDGTQNGQLLPEGIYYYVLQSDNQSSIYKGIITLKR